MFSLLFESDEIFDFTKLYGIASYYFYPKKDFALDLFYLAQDGVLLLSYMDKDKLGLSSPTRFSYLKRSKRTKKCDVTGLNVHLIHFRNPFSHFKTLNNTKPTL